MVDPKSGATRVWKGAASGNWQIGRAGVAPTAIVIHIAEGSLAGTDAWFDTPPWARPAPHGPTSAHYCVGKDGTVHQYVQEKDRAFHAGNVDKPVAKQVLTKREVNPNLYSIGVEHEGRVEDLGPWPEAQREASVSLVREICNRWSIPITRDTIIGHHEIYSVKPCPGPGVDLDAFVAECAKPPIKEEPKDGQ